MVSEPGWLASQLASLLVASGKRCCQWSSTYARALLFSLSPLAGQRLLPSGAAAREQQLVTDCRSCRQIWAQLCCFVGTAGFCVGSSRAAGLRSHCSVFTVTPAANILGGGAKKKGRRRRGRHQNNQQSRLSRDLSVCLPRESFHVLMTNSITLAGDIIPADPRGSLVQ